MKEYGIISLTGESPAGGDPDTIANTYLGNWNLIPLDGNPANLFKGARAKDDYKPFLKIKIWTESGQTRCSLFFDTSPVATYLDRGKVISPADVSNLPEEFEIRIQANYVAKMKIKCGPVLPLPETPLSVALLEATPTPDSNSASSDVESGDPEKEKVIISVAETADGVKVVGQVLAVPQRLVRRMQGQPRKHFDEEKLREFSNDLKEQGQTQPAIVKRLKEPDTNGCIYELISGERRWRCTQLAGIPFLLIIIRETVDDVDQYVQAVIANCNAEELSLLETMETVGKLHAMGKSDEEIGRIHGKRTKQWAYSLRHALTLDVEVLKLLGPETPEENRLTLQKVQPLIGLPREEQIKYAQMAGKGNVSAARIKYLVRDLRHQYGIANKSRASEEFASISTFFRTANEQVEAYADLSENQLASFFSGRDVKDTRVLLARIKDLRDNLGVVHKAFLLEAQKDPDFTAPSVWQ